MRILHASLVAASPLAVNAPCRAGKVRGVRWQPDQIGWFRMPAVADVPVQPGSEIRLGQPHEGMAVLLTVLALGFPVSMLMLAKATGSDLLGWVFGLVLMLEFMALPWIALFGFGRSLRCLLGNRSR